MNSNMKGKVMDPKALPAVIVTIYGNQESVDFGQKFEIVVDDWNFAEENRISSNLIVRNANTGEILLEEDKGIFSLPIAFVDLETFEDALRKLILDFVTSDIETYRSLMTADSDEYSFNGKCAEMFYHFSSEIEQMWYEAEYKLLYGEIDLEKVGYIFETAVYHAIDYWCDITEIVRDGKLDEVIDLRNVTKITLVEYEDGETHTVYEDDLWRGMVLAAKYQEMDMEEWFEDHDAISADMAVQFAIFEELVYG